MFVFVRFFPIKINLAIQFQKCVKKLLQNIKYNKIFAQLPFRYNKAHQKEILNSEK